MKAKSVIAGMAISMAMIGSAMAESISTIAGIPAEAISHSELNKIKGRWIVPCVVRSICGYGNNVLPGNWNFVSTVFQDIRTYYPQIWYPSFPLSYPINQGNTLTASIDSKYGNLFNAGFMLMGYVF